MYLSKLFTLLAAVLTLCHIALAGTSVLIPWTTADGGYGSGAIYGLAIEGDTAYLLLSLNNKVQFVRISDIGGAQVRTQLMDHVKWLTASGQNGCTPFQGFDFSGSEFVQFAEVASDEIWRINKSTGLLIKYCDLNTITNVTGTSSRPNLGSVHCVNPANGEHVFYDSNSGHLLITGGSNVLSILIHYTAWTNALGTNAVYNGGMNYDNSGNLYIGNSASGDVGGLVRRDSGGNLILLFNRPTITNLSLVTTLNFGTMKMGPDGRFYFRTGSGTAASILSFDPANPAATLSRFVSSAELIASVATNSNVNCLRYYGTYPNPSSGWAWHQFGTNAVYLTAIPEPAAFALLGLAALLLRRVR